jgi:hypothetical protein
MVSSLPLAVIAALANERNKIVRAGDPAAPESMTRGAPDRTGCCPVGAASRASQRLPEGTGVC